jgi:HAD superfamily hydrolase (TIGR01509 family)
MGRMKAADFDAVTFDAHGTLVTLADPVPALMDELSARGVERTQEAVLAGFRTEVAHYAPRASEGHDEESLARLQRECAGVFLGAVNAELDPDEFAPAYVDALHFALLPGVLESLERLQALGLELAVVANWDLSLKQLLGEVGLARYFRVVVPAARKPAPDGLLRALGEVWVDPARALHIGDEGADREAAAAAGMRFAPTPVPAATAAIR